MDIRKILPKAPVLVDLDRVEEKPGPFCMSFGFDLTPLISSIEAVGLIHLPLVVRNRAGLFDPVTGYLRLKALKALHWDKVPCMDLSHTGLSPVDLLFLNLQDNLSVRRLNNVEKGMVVARFRGYMSEEKIRENYAGFLQLSREWDLEVLLKIEGLPERVKTAIADGSISMNSMGRLVGVDERSFLAALKRMTDLRLNFNQQLKFIDYIIDISIREKRPVYRILDEESFLDLRDDKRINTPQKAKKMLGLLKKRRYPFIFSAEISFQEMVGGLHLPPGVRIRHPPSFESPEYRLEVDFKDGMELIKKIKLMTQDKDITKIKDPWDPRR